MATITTQARVPNSPFLNEPFAVAFTFGSLATVTGAFCRVGGITREVKASGASFIASFQAGSVATGTWTVYGFESSAGQGSYTAAVTIKIRNSDIADPAKTLYDILRTNIGTTYSSTVFSTGWYSADSVKPMVTVTRGGWTTRTYNLGDTHRWHEVTLHVDAWVPDVSPASAFFGATGYKNSLTLLDTEIKRIVDSQNKAPSTKLLHLMVLQSIPLDEITDPRRIFRTRHNVRALWSETIA